MPRRKRIFEGGLCSDMNFDCPYLTGMEEGSQKNPYCLTFGSKDKGTYLDLDEDDDARRCKACIATKGKP